jgi:hypothetical protein
MTLRKLNDLHAGEQNPDGSYVILHTELTICDECLFESAWGYTEYPDTAPGDSCGICA